ncbi:epoxide hydrolase [Pseudonocardia sp. S2-4]|uniref:Epoxide hydrolase n=1 Tax=Pseudonocardia humida TaxID=2800819 RepID=A0ABT1A6W8_9PSEU|nr:epoxide hydrolase [Pseudonocardia humida]
MAVDDAVLDDLAIRLQRTRWPDDVGAGWADGTDVAYLRELVGYWRDRFDWRAAEQRLNRLPQFRAGIDGVGVHFVHERGRGPDPLPLVLTHGWPSTFAEPGALVPMLTDPARFGADPADSFDVVVPSLPGFGFSDRPRGPGTARRLPRLWVRLMSEVLGYRRFAAHGTDIGAFVTNRLALEHPEHVVGVHVGHWAEPDVDTAELTGQERRFVEARVRNAEAEGGYAHVQRTRPQSLAFGLTDSPAGLAGWIVEKWRSWGDCAGDVERRFTKDDLLTTVMIYWVTGTIASSVRLYKEWALASRPHPACPVPPVPPGAGESAPLPAGRRIEPPARLALFLPGGDPPPVSWIERAYARPQVAVMPRGGHFPAMEEPQLLVEDIRAFFRPLRH